MVRIRNILWVLSLVMPILAAASPWTVDAYKNVEFSVAAGPAWLRTGSTDLTVSPTERDSVIVNQVSNNPLWKIGVGYHFFAEQLKPRIVFNDFLLELNLYQSSGRIKGVVWQSGLPQFNNYTFSAPITTTRLMLDFKPGLITLKHVTLYPIAGAGVAWKNIAYNESVANNTVDPGSTYLLNSTAVSDFAYDLGAGIRADLTEHLSATLEYLYSNLSNAAPSDISKNNNLLLLPPTFKIFDQSVFLGLSWKI